MLDEKLKRCTCPACSSVKFSKAIDIKRKENFSKKRQLTESTSGCYNGDDTLLKCHGCDFLFVLRDHIIDYKKKDRDYFSLLSQQDRLKEYRYLADKIESRIAKGRILDVGCGTGSFLESIIGEWEKVGVEPSVYASEIAKSRGIEILQGEYISIEYSKRHFDVITMIDVLEHLEHPKENIEKVFSMLRPGGILAIETGDSDSITARLAGYRWAYFCPKEHISFFSRGTLVELLKKIGFTNIEVSKVTHGQHYGKDFKLFIKEGMKALMKVFIIGFRDFVKKIFPQIDLYNFLPPFNQNFKIPHFLDHIVVVASKPLSEV